MKKIVYVLGLVLLAASCNKEKENPCKAPVFSVTESNVNGGAVYGNISGTEGFTQIEYGPNGFTKGTGTTILGTSNFLIEDMVNGAYDFYVRTNCGGDSWSDWQGPKSIFVQGGSSSSCAKPYDLSLSHTYTGFRWEHNTSNLFQVEYGVSGYTKGTGTKSITSTKVYYGYSFSANTTYDFYVRAICSPGDTSLWAGPYSYHSSGNYHKCLAPINLTAYRNGGVIEYSFNGNGEDNFEVLLNNTNSTNSSNIHQVNTSSGAFTGIYSNVTYYFFARGICQDGSKTAWSGPIVVN